MNKYLSEEQLKEFLRPESEKIEQECIGFAEWIVDGTYDNVAGDYDGIVTFQKPTKELYQLYLKSKQLQLV